MPDRILIRALAALALSVALPVAASGIVPSGTVDDDGDGWTETDGDCCDTTAACPIPVLVNPGALDLAANGIDDDCSGGIDDPAANCSVVSDLTAVTALQVAQAIEVCQTTTASPPLANRRWGLIGSRFELANGGVPNATQLGNMQNLQSAILAEFGPAVLPRVGTTMAALSNGRARDANDPGFIAPQGGSSFNTSVVPSLLLGAPECQNTVNAFDSIVVELDLRVPTNVSLVAVDERFYSAEFPDRCAQFNDQAHIVIVSQSPGIPANGNIAFDQAGNPLTVHSVEWQWCLPGPAMEACPSGTAELAGTGHDTLVSGSSAGAATSWTTARAPIVPGETITLRFTIFDGADGSNDSLLLFDNLRWLQDTIFANGFE